MGEGMSKRRQLRRESLEVYLVHFILKYRYILVLIGFLLMGYSFFVLSREFLIGSIFLLPSIYLLLLGFSFPVVLFTSRVAAWLATLNSGEE